MSTPKTMVRSGVRTTPPPRPVIAPRNPAARDPRKTSDENSKTFMRLASTRTRAGARASRARPARGGRPAGRLLQQPRDGEERDGDPHQALSRDDPRGDRDRVLLGELRPEPGEPH